MAATVGYKSETEPQWLGLGVLMETVVDIDGGMGWGGEYEVMAVAECFVCLHKWGQRFSAKSSQPSH
jgi:hypothetical protein